MRQALRSKRWRWRCEPLVFVGATVIAADVEKCSSGASWNPTGLAFVLPFVVGAIAFLVLGWRLEQR